MGNNEDKIDDLRKKLQKVVHGFEHLKNLGINEEILVAYIQYKTKLSVRDIREVLKSYEEFHTKLINTAALDALEDNQ